MSNYDLYLGSIDVSCTKYSPIQFEEKRKSEISELHEGAV